MDLDSWRHFIHVLAAIVWVGGNLSLLVLGTRVARAKDARQMHQLSGHFEFIGTRIFTPASLLILLTGIWMTIAEDWGFDNFWILAALAMFAYSVLSGILYLSPQMARAKKLFDQEGSSSEAAAEIIKKVFVVARIEAVLLILIVADMVFKPFA